MKQLLLLLILSVSLFSCITQKKCNERFPPEIHDSISYVDKVVTVHDTVKIEGDDIIFHDTIPCPALEYHHSVTKNNLTSRVDISKGVIKVDCKEDSLLKIIEHQNHIITTSHNETKIEEKIVEKENWYDPICHWWTIISLLAIGVWLGIKYLKFK